MIKVKYFDEFQGNYYDVTGTSGQTMRFDSNGNLDVSVPLWGDISGNINLQLDLKNLLQNYLELNTWVDYSSTTTVNGFSSTTTKKVQYLIVGNLRIVHYQIVGTSNATNFNFTLPFSGSSFADQFFVGHAVNNGTTQNICIAKVTASSSTVDLYLGNNTTTPNAWTNTNTKRAEGTLIIAI